MKNTQYGAVIVICLSGIMVGVFALGEKQKAPEASPIVISGWHQTPPPLATPFIGVYIDKSIDPRALLHYGTQYWEYAPTLKPPIGASYGSLPPAFWIEMPGAAK